MNATLARLTRLAAAELEVEQARAKLQVAAARYDQAQAELERLGVQFTYASRSLQAAQARPEELRRGTSKNKPGSESNSTFSIHIRPLAAPEKVIRVKATGNDTVLEALAHAAQDMAIKPDAFSAWIVRGKEVLPVDLPGILQRGETTTNYAPKGCDQHQESLPDGRVLE